MLVLGDVIFGDRHYFPELLHSSEEESDQPEASQHLSPGGRLGLPSGCEDRGSHDKHRHDE
jgi:hypothetical protein